TGNGDSIGCPGTVVPRPTGAGPPAGVPTDSPSPSDSPTTPPPSTEPPATTPPGTTPPGSQPTTGPPPPPPPLSAPVLASPADGSLFYNFPRVTTLQWQAVSGAAQYDIEIQCDTCNGQWSTWSTATVATTSYTFTWVGDNQGRWRVTAVAPSGTRGTSSGFL